MIPAATGAPAQNLPLTPVLHLVPELQPVQTVEASTLAHITDGDILATFHDWMTRRNLSPQTIRLWVETRARFAEWLGKCTLYATTDDIEEWLWEVQPDLAPASRAAYRKALRAFFQWSVREGHIDVDPTDRVPTPKLPVYRPYPMLTPMLLRAIDTADVEMRAWICLGCYQGLRVAEMSSLLWADVNDENLTVMGKGRKQRTVPTHPQALEAMRALSFTDDLVLGGTTPQKISHYGTTFLRGIGARSTRPMHSLRAWYATELYRASGFDLLLVRDMLGHTSTDITALYVGVGDDAAAKAVSVLHVGPKPTTPRGKWMPLSE